jgi:hypothetical protein
MTPAHAGHLLGSAQGLCSILPRCHNTRSRGSEPWDKENQKKYREYQVTTPAHAGQHLGYESCIPSSRAPVTTPAHAGQHLGRPWPPPPPPYPVTTPAHAGQHLGVVCHRFAAIQYVTTPAHAGQHLGYCVCGAVVQQGLAVDKTRQSPWFGWKWGEAGGGSWNSGFSRRSRLGCGFRQERRLGPQMTQMAQIIRSLDRTSHAPVG